MKYLCLIYYDQRKFAGWSKAERDALWVAAGAYALELANAGTLVGSSALAPTTEAVTRCVALSIGAVVFDEPPFKIEALKRASDAAMYNAKSNGKNGLYVQSFVANNNP